MGWAAYEDLTSSDNTDYRCSQMARRFKFKTFLRFFVGQNMELAIRHKCTKEGDIFRVY